MSFYSLLELFAHLLGLRSRRFLSKYGACHLRVKRMWIANQVVRTGLENYDQTTPLKVVGDIFGLKK